MGFSQNTGRPARADKVSNSAWVAVLVAMTTPSRPSGFAGSNTSSTVAVPHPRLSASLEALSGVEPDSTSRPTSGWSSRIPACISPMRPTPTSAITRSARGCP
nr:hypothetical protein [Tessaracoccus coleopterorum]